MLVYVVLDDVGEGEVGQRAMVLVQAELLYCCWEAFKT